MRTATRIAIWTAVSAASLGVHLAAFGGLGSARPDSLGRIARKRPPTVVEMEVASKPPPPPPAATPELARAPAPARKLALARPARANNPVAPRTTPSAPPPPAETVADFSGVTLTNQGPGPGWSSATGNGEAMRGPVGKPGALVTGRNTEGAAPMAAPVVGLGDLSRAPEAPSLADVLERRYPADARRKGLAGSARVRLRVMPEGTVREVVLLSESSAGFGEACRLTVRGSRWTPPMDRAGQAVSTYVQYTCRFEVR